MKRDIDLIVIGGSSGSLDVVIEILKGLEKDFDLPIILVLHRLKNTKAYLVDLFKKDCKLEVKEVEEKEKIKKGTVYIVPANYHLLIESDHSFSLTVSEKVNFSRPSIDVTFESAAFIFQKKMLGVILTGANRDGAEGIKMIKKMGGLCMVQDPKTALMKSMPESAMELLGTPDYIFSPNEMTVFFKTLKKFNYEKEV